MKKRILIFTLVLFFLSDCNNLPGQKDAEESSSLPLLLSLVGPTQGARQTPNGVTCSNPEFRSGITFTVGTSILGNRCRLIDESAGVPTFTLTPSLPSGLETVLENEGRAFTVRGTPSAPLTRTQFLLSVRIGERQFTETWFLTVLAEAPRSVSFFLGTMVAGISSKVQVSFMGCRPCNFSIRPNLPDGLSLNATTGEISGIPTSIQSSTSYVVTASNSLGTLDSNASNLTIVPLTANYAGSALYYAVNTSISASPEVRSATNATFSISSGSLPAGLNLAASGTISGTTPGVRTISSLTVRGSNSLGNQNSNLSSIRVLPVSEMTCNTSGVATGCSASQPFSCTDSNFCYSSLDQCRRTEVSHPCRF